jgi:hypothetical protein
MQEIQAEKDRSQELIDKILRRSKVILDGLLRVASSPNGDRLQDIEGKLKDYNEYGCSFILCLDYRLHFLQSPWKNSRSTQDAYIKECHLSNYQPEVKARQPGEI